MIDGEGQDQNRHCISKTDDAYGPNWVFPCLVPSPMALPERQVYEASTEFSNCLPRLTTHFQSTQ